MRKRILTIIIIGALVYGFFAAGGNIQIENGIPVVSFNGSWEDVGASIGNAVGDLVDGFVDEFADTDTVSGISSIIAPEIPTGSTFQVHYIDVGQADSTLIICDDTAMLIDGGENENGKEVVAYLKSVGVTELDLIVGTHAHSDHIGGLDDVLNAFPVEEVWYPDYRHGTATETSFLAAAEGQGLTPSQPDPGTTYTLGSAVCQVVGPITLDPDEPNNHSIVIKVLYGETSFLFTGDAEMSAETEILDAGYDISCDVLKVAHHGSSSSTKYRWLRAAAPTYAIISVGADNEYGHPTETTLSLLEDADTIVYRTDLQGNIICTSDGMEISFTT